MLGGDGKQRGSLGHWRNGMRNSISRLVVAAFVVLGAGYARADDPTLKWQTIIGVVQAGNTVGGIAAGGQPWSTLGGNATVNLATGQVNFRVDGLVFAGGNSIGTPDGVAQVKGTLVCGVGTATQGVFDTALVDLSPTGDARFEGAFDTAPPRDCASPVAFLVRIAAGRWIANGAVLLQ
jgi:hypothetical protein